MKEAYHGYYDQRRVAFGKEEKRVKMIQHLPSDVLHCKHWVNERSEKKCLVRFYSNIYAPTYNLCRNPLKKGG